MLGRKKSEDTEGEAPPALEKEQRVIAQLNTVAYGWLGPRYAWFNKIRTAQKSAFPLLGGQNLEQQMEATRSALQLLGRNFQNGLAMGVNSTLTSLKGCNYPLEGLPEKIETADRSTPPTISDEHDALIISFAPIKFLSLGKMVRDKGKGVEFYADGLIKKLYFKVVGFFCDPANWYPERQGYFLHDLPADADFATVNGRISPLKADLESFASGYQMFHFGKTPRREGEAGVANTLDETFELSTKDLVADLFFQSFIINGLEKFLFRYYLTLVSATKNPRALRGLTSAFQPALAKVEEIRLNYQASFSLEREKIRLRPQFQEFYKETENQPVVELVKVKKQEVRKINYIHKLLETTAYPRGPNFSEKQARHWQEYLKREVVDHIEEDWGRSVLLELLTIMLRITQFSVDAKLKVAEALRDFATNQEKMAVRQVAEQKRKLGEAKRRKLATARKFRTTKQFDVVKTIEAEAQALEETGHQEIEKFEEAVVRRKEGMLERAAQMKEGAEEEGKKLNWQSAAALYKLVNGLDPESDVRNVFIPFLLEHIQTDNDTAYLTLYKNLFHVVSGMYPMEKVVLRKALQTKINLEEDEMVVTPEEEAAYQEQIVAGITQLNLDAPNTLEHRLVQGQVNTTVENLLDVGITRDSLRLVLSLPVNLPNKPTVRLPRKVVSRLLGLSQLKNPFPETDLILPNVDPNSPAAKRLNLNRLAKLLG